MLSAFATAFWSLLGLLGFPKPQSPEVRGISKFQVNRDNEESKMQLEIGLDVFNPNPYVIAVMEHDLDVFFNGKVVGKTAERRRSVLQEKDNSQLTFGVRTDLTKVLGGIGCLVGGLVGGLVGNLVGGQAGGKVSGAKKVDVRVKGFVRARAKGIIKKVPVDFAKSYEL